MATISLIVPDGQLNRLVNGIAGQHGYQSTVPAPNPLDPPLPNPETKSQFAKRMMLKWAKESVKAWEATQSANTARDIAAADVEAGLTLT